MNRHNHDVSYLSQDRTRSKARSRASHVNYRRSRDNAATVADPEISSVEPEIRPLAFDRPIEEGIDPFINVFAQVGTWLFEYRTAHRLHQVVDAPGRDAADPSFLDDWRLLRGLARLKMVREVRAFVPNCADQAFDIGSPRKRRSPLYPLNFMKRD